MDTLLMILIIISSIVLIINVALQEDKTGGLSGSFGGGATDSAWGKNKGKTFEALLDKLVIVTAVVIVVSSIALVAIQK